MATAAPSVMDKLVSLCLNRGFIYPSSEIYSGIAGFWDYVRMRFAMNILAKTSPNQMYPTTNDPAVSLSWTKM